MNLTTLMQGKITYRAAYTLIAAGVYVMAVQVGDLLVPPVDYVFMTAEILKGEGFKLFVGGWVVWGLRRAMAKGGAEKPPLTEEQKAEQAADLHATLADVEKHLKALKGNSQ